MKYIVLLYDTWWILIQRFPRRERIFQIRGNNWLRGDFYIEKFYRYRWLDAQKEDAHLFYFLLQKKIKFSFEDYTCFELFNFPIFFLARWKTIKNLFLTITINHFHAFTLTGTIPLNTPLFHLSLTQNTISTASSDNYFHLRRPYSPSSSVIIFHPFTLHSMIQCDQTNWTQRITRIFTKLDSRRVYWTKPLNFSVQCPW